MKINGEVYRKAVRNVLDEVWSLDKHISKELIKRSNAEYKRLMNAKQPKIKKVR